MRSCLRTDRRRSIVLVLIQTDGFRTLNIPSLGSTQSYCYRTNRADRAQDERRERQFDKQRFYYGYATRRSLRELRL